MEYQSLKPSFADINEYVILSWDKFPVLRKEKAI
jgi:hypothetical protein